MRNILEVQRYHINSMRQTRRSKSNSFVATAFEVYLVPCYNKQVCTSQEQSHVEAEKSFTSPRNQGDVVWNRHQVIVII